MNPKKDNLSVCRLNSTCLMLLFCLSTTVSLSQEVVPRVQFGGYSSLLLSNSDYFAKARLGYEIGTSFIIKKKDTRIRRKELFLQFSENNYRRDSRNSLPNSAKTDTAYSVSDYKIRFLNFGLRWQIPIVHREKYRLLLTPGFTFGSILSYNFTRKAYLFSDNSLLSETDNKGFLLTNVTLGFTAGISNEIQLTKLAYLHVNLNWLSQSTFEYENSGPWRAVGVRVGIYKYLPYHN